MTSKDENHYPIHGSQAQGSCPNGSGAGSSLVAKPLSDSAVSGSCSHGSGGSSLVAKPLSDSEDHHQDDLPFDGSGAGSSLVAKPLSDSEDHDQDDSDCDSQDLAFDRLLLERANYETSALRNGMSSLGNSTSKTSHQGQSQPEGTTSQGQGSSGSRSYSTGSGVNESRNDSADSEDESKRTFSDMNNSEEYDDESSSDHRRKQFSDYGDEEEESEEDSGSKRCRRKSNSDSLLKPCYLNADGYTNKSFCMLLSEVAIGEKMSQDLKKLPHSSGHQWKRPTNVPICVWVKGRDRIKTVNISTTLASITRAIYNTGSEMGYIGNIKRETSHFDITIERLKAPVGTHPISGMFHPNLLNSLLESKEKEVMKWLVKWKLLIPNRLGTLKDKCNFTSGTR